MCYIITHLDKKSTNETESEDGQVALTFCTRARLHFSMAVESSGGRLDFSSPSSISFVEIVSIRCRVIQVMESERDGAENIK